MTTTTATTTNPHHDRLAAIVRDHRVVLFMKGTQAQPQCGFSQMATRILHHFGVDFKDINVLANESDREAIKAFSSWPTFPQLYIDGELVGGCDIMREMFESGELQTMLTEKKLAN